MIPKKIAKRGSKHYRRQVEHPMWAVWNGMKQRCKTPSNPDYKSYGGRGIKVCDRWLSFVNFIEDMGPRPEGHTLDRYPNNDGNYEPGNCRWATPRTQATNRSSTRIITVDNVTRSISGWSVHLGINRHHIYKSIESYGDVEGIRRLI